MAKLLASWGLKQQQQATREEEQGINAESQPPSRSFGPKVEPSNFAEDCEEESGHAEDPRRLLSSSIDREETKEEQRQSVGEREKQEALNLSSRGVSLEESGNVDEAVSAYREAISVDAECVDAHYNLGVALGKRGEMALAAESYRRTIELEANHCDAHNNLGSIYETQGNFTAAIFEYSVAVKLAPVHHTAPRLNLADLLHETGSHDRAIEEYKIALNCDPNDVDAWNSLGIVLEASGRLSDAIVAYRRATKFQVDENPDALQNLAGALLAKGEKRNAIAAYTELLERQPDNEEVRQILQDLKRQSPDAQYASLGLDKSINLESRQDGVLYGSVAQKASDSPASIQGSRVDPYLAPVEKLAAMANTYVISTRPRGDHMLDLFDGMKKLRGALFALRDDVPCFCDNRPRTKSISSSGNGLVPILTPPLCELPHTKSVESLDCRTLQDSGNQRARHLYPKIDRKILRQTEQVIKSCISTTKKWAAKGSLSKKVQGYLIYEKRFRALNARLEKCYLELQASLPPAIRSRRLHQIFPPRTQDEGSSGDGGDGAVTHLYSFDPADPDNAEHNSLLGKGTFGRTHVMKSWATRRRRAVYIINVERAEAQGVDLKALIRDLYQAEEFRHPHIVRCFGAFFAREGRDLCIPMEFVAGGTLAKQVGSRHDFGTLQLWERQLSGALAYIHGRGLQHGDLRPENVLLSNHNKCVKVCDAGRSALIASGLKRKRPDAELYFSPERFNEHAYDEKDDVWALGCITVSLVVGKRLEEWCTRRQFFCVDRQAIRKAISQGKHAHAELGALAKKMLDRDPTLRPAAREIYSFICAINLKSSGEKDDGEKDMASSADNSTTLLGFEGRRLGPSTAGGGDGDRPNMADKIERARGRLHNYDSQLDRLLEDSRPRRLVSAMVVVSDRSEIQLAATNLERRFPGLGGLVRRLIADRDIVRDESASAVTTFCETKWRTTNGVAAEPVTISAMARLVIAGAAEVKEAALLVLRHLATEDRINRLAIVKYDGLLGAIAHMLDGSMGIGAKTAAASLISHIAVSSDIKATLGDTGAVAALVAMLDTAIEASTLEESVTALENLVRGSDANQSTAKRAGAVPRLIAIIEAGGPAAEPSTRALKSLIAKRRGGGVDDTATEDDFSQLQANSIPALCRLLRSDHSDGELKEGVAVALRKLAMVSNGNRSSIANAGAIPALIKMLFDTASSDSSSQAAVKALSILAYNHRENRREIGKATPSVVSALIRFIDKRSTSSDGLREAATNALLSLIVDGQNRSDFIAAGGIAPVVELVGNHRAAGVEDAVTILRSLAHSDNKSSNSTTLELLHDIGAIPALVSYISRTKSEASRANAIWTLKEMALADEDYQVAIVDAGAVGLLVHFLDRSASDDTSLAASWALKSLTKDKGTRIQVAKALGLDVSEDEMRLADPETTTDSTGRKLITEGQVDETIDRRREATRSQAINREVTTPPPHFA